MKSNVKQHRLSFLTNKLCLSALGTSLNDGNGSKFPFVSCLLLFPIPNRPPAAAAAATCAGTTTPAGAAPLATGAPGRAAATVAFALPGLPAAAATPPATAGAEDEAPPPGAAAAVADEADASLLLLSPFPLVPRWITRFNLNTIPSSLTLFHSPTPPLYTTPVLSVSTKIPKTTLPAFATVSLHISNQLLPCSHPSGPLHMLAIIIAQCNPLSFQPFHHPHETRKIEPRVTTSPAMILQTPHSAADTFLSRSHSRLRTPPTTPSPIPSATT